VVFLDRDQPILFCTGVRRHAIVVSRGAVRLLDREELRAALAHELAHLSRHDPGASWLVMAARALMFFNPAFQVLSRALARDAEWLADERAAAACGDRLALASGLIKLHRATAGPLPVRRTLPFAAALAEPLARVRSLDVEVRCRRLLDGPPARLPYARARLVLTGASLTGLLFFVV
jgi:Zn-dependent protease with chaperone function